MSRIRARFSPEDVAKLEGMLEIISRELMPEIPWGTRSIKQNRHKKPGDHRIARVFIHIKLDQSVT